jgi:hypothetical protein
MEHQLIKDSLLRQVMAIISKIAIIRTLMITLEVKQVIKVLTILLIQVEVMP